MTDPDAYFIDDLALSVTPVDATLALALILWAFLIYLAIRQRPY